VLFKTFIETIFYDTIFKLQAILYILFIRLGNVAALVLYNPGVSLMLLRNTREILV